jgi:hypothetical protein
MYKKTLAYHKIRLLSVNYESVMFYNTKARTAPMEQRASKILNICFNANIYSYLEISGGQSLNQYLNVVHFFNISVDYTSVAT